MEDLTLADKKILYLIEYNPRISYKELAGACHLSKDTIKYRVARLEREKIILGYSCFVDYKKLGNQSYKLYLKLNGTLEQRNSLKEYLRKQKNVFAIFESVGNWNLAIAIFAKTHEEFNKIENELLENFGNIITNRRFCTMIDVQMYHKNFFQTSKDVETFKVWGEVKNEKLDDIDKKLIKIIHANSRESLVEISAQLKLSIDAVKNRIKRLRERGIAGVYQTNINYEKLGYDHYKLFVYPEVYSDKTESEIISFLRETKSCINIVRTIGPWKLEAEFFAEKSQEIENIIYQLNEKFKGNILDLELATLRNEELFACKDLLLD